MLSNPLSSKSRKKIKKTLSTNELPDNWTDFARLCDIRSGSTIMKFDPYDYQIELIGQIEQNRTIAIAKTRQLGVTETISNYFLYHACRNPGYLGVIFSRKQADTSNIAKRLRRQLESLSYLGITTSSNNLLDIEIENGGRISFRNSTLDGMRGLESVSHILFDEAAFIEQIEELYGNALPTTSMVADAKIIINSTPNGQSGFYYDLLSSDNGDINLLEKIENVRNGEPSYCYWNDDNNILKFLIHWKGHPIYSKQENYLENLQKQFRISKEKLLQEFDLSFLESDESVFDFHLIKNAITDDCRASEANPSGVFCFGIDTSLMGQDYTVVVILELINDVFYLRDYYRKRKQPQDLHLHNISKLIDRWQPLSIGIEVNGAGQLYYEQISKNNGLIEIKAIKTTETSKPLMIQQVVSLLESGKLKIPDDRILIDEFYSYRRQGSKLGAITGKHDDLIMALAIAIDGYSRR